MGAPDEDSQSPYAPVPVSVQPTRLRLGSWFQSRPLAVKVIASLGMLFGLTYLSWRLIFTSVGIEPWIFWPLFLAELFGFSTFLLLVYEAWETPSTPRPPTLNVRTSILITTYNEDIDILEPTVVGALLVRGDTEIFLSDDGRREEMRELAERYGINYLTRTDSKHAKAGNVNAALPKLSGDLVLILDADHVPAPDILDAMSGYFSDPEIALVQSAHSFRNHNSVMHEETGRHEQSLFFDVLLPGRNRRGSVFWCGSAALIRMSALVEVGGVATKTSTEDFETSLLLQIRGYKTRYHNEHLVQGLAPDNLPAYVTQRARWAQGTLSAFRLGYALPLHRKLTLKQRISYLGAFLYYVTPLQRMVYTAYVVMVGLFGLVPVAEAGPTYLALWASYVIITFTAVAALERGSTQPLEGVRNTFLSLEAFLRALPILFNKKIPGFAVTPKNEVDMGGWGAMVFIRLPLFIIGLNALVIGLRWIDYLVIAILGYGFLPPLPFFASLALSGFGLLEIVVIGLLAKKLFDRRQLRKLWRFPVRVNASIQGQPATVVDLHQKGMAVYAPSHLVQTSGSLDVSLQLVDLQGQPKLATGTFTPRSARRLQTNLNALRIGGEIAWHNHESRSAVIEYCYVAQPYRARNHFWSRRAPRVPVLLDANVAGQISQAIDVSIGGAGFKVFTQTGFEVGSVHPITVQVEGEEVSGRLTVRDSRELEPGLFRVGGEVEWNATGWLNQILQVEHKPLGASSSIHGVLRR